MKEHQLRKRSASIKRNMLARNRQTNNLLLKHLNCQLKKSHLKNPNQSKNKKM
jgi:hypothetical protein